MKNQYLRQVGKLCLAIFALLLSTQLSRAQLSGNKTVGIDYPNIATFVTDVNTQGVLIGGGGVTLLVPAGYSETAPVGGYSITATGTAAENITIVGAGSPQPIITANAGLTVGSLNDAIFKIIGGDYINIANLDMRENAANTTTAAATNNMTEFGVALFYASTTDGAQRNSVINNSITLNRTYTNSFGVYSNVRHNATTVTTAADITAFSGSNSNNKVYGNTISNVNMGITFIGSGTAAYQDQGNDIGGTGVSTGNIISNWGGASAVTGFISNSGTSYCIFVNHQTGENVSYNTLTSASVSGTAVTFRGIVKDYSTTSATGTFTSTISNNTITMTSGFTSGTFQHITSAGLTGLSTATININNNTILNSAVTGAASSSAIVGIINSSAPGTLNINSNVIRGLNSTATTGGFAGITNAGAVINTININSNQIGNASGGAITYSVATSGSFAGIVCTTAGTSSILNINSNNFQGISYSVASSAANSYISCSATPASFTANLNTFTNLNINSTGSATFIAHSYSMPASGTQLFNNNSIVTGYSKTGAGGTVALTTTNGSSPNSATTTYTNNNFSNITLTGATTFSGFNNTDGSGSAATKVFTGNTINNLTGGTNSITCLNFTYLNGVSSITGNNFTNITGQSSVTAINIGSSFNGATSFSISNNTITGLSSTGTGGAVTGITTSNTSAGISISNNDIHGLSSTGASLVSAIGVTGASATSIIANRIYSLSSSNAGGTVFGINVTSGAGVNTYNNIISALTAPNASGTDVIRGISINSSTTTNYGVYFNSVYLNASSGGANFGTTGIYHQASATAGTASLDLRNNIVINESTPNGTGFTVAFRRSGVALNNYAATSNRNLFYSGAPGASRLIMYDGTTSYQTIAAYQAAVSTRDLNSFTGEAAFTASGYGTAGNFFISLTGASVDFLRPVAGITTQVEGGGITISSPSITIDYSSTTRPGTPDLGAYEFTGVTPVPVITLNSVTPPATTQCVAIARLVSVNITTASGTITAASLGYTVNGVAQTPIAMTNTSGSTWTVTIPVPTPTNATIAWTVAATNSIGLNGSYTGTTYSDEPLTGVISNATSTPGTTCAGDPSQLMAIMQRNGIVASGTGSTTVGTSSAGDPTSPLAQYYESQHTQYLVLASDLTAAGLSAGNITNLAYTVTSKLSTKPFTSYTIKLAPSALTNLTGGNNAATFTTVYASSSTVGSGVSSVTGLNNFVFGTGSTATSFTWDGTSNILIDICFANDPASTGTYYSDNDAVAATTKGYTASYGSYQDNANLCGAISSTANSNKLPNFIFTGNTAPAIQTVSWSDGATTVGTGNPLAVNPTTTTTYTATITAAGCTVAPAPTTTVTVNPLPSAPTATNSAQCGTQIPTASVASTSGLPTPTFVWYSAPTAGTVMQNSTSTTYTSNVASTTTFYVSELNSVTGCLSTRTPVTVTVASADGIQASIDNATICIGSSVVISVVNTNPTPNQSYIYTWTSTAGSGLASQSGTPLTITPTLAGSYTYNVSGVDGLCNAVSSVNVTVDPFTSTVTPINITCNGYNNGSFSQGAVTCGTAASYSVDGGSFGPIPTNLTPGTHTVVTMNTGGYTSASQSITITQPSTVITTPTGTNASVCQNSASAMVSATSGTNTAGAPVTIVVPFNVAAQPTETNAAPGNIVATATYSALPAGSTVTGASLNYNNLQALSSSWESDIRLGLSGAIVDAAASGTGSTNSAGNFNYTRTVPNASVNVAGGTINLLYWDYVSDNGGAEATFPTGAGVANLTITYTPPAIATISWWDASTAGTQIGTGSPFETVGTSVVPNTNTPGVYTVYAQGNYGGCSTVTRTPVTVTVKAKSTSTVTATACTSYTLNATTYTSTGTYTQILTNAAGCDSTITLNLTIKNASASTTTISTCDTYTWTNGATYTTSGTHTQTLVNAVGCDSIATLNLTIKHSNTGIDTRVACDTYTWINGVTYTSSTNTPTFTLTNVAGCDSVVTLHLTIGTANTGTDTHTACSSYTWNSTTYTTSGTYVQTLVNAAGCDSVVTLTLTINYPSTSTTTITACDSYTWTNGTTYTTSGTHTQTLTNAAGCDSIATLNLTINHSSTSATTTTACTSYTWTNGTTYTSSGTYTQTLTNAVGCDSIATLNLTINQPTTFSMTQTACSSFTLNGTTYTSSGTYTQTSTNAAGCDSTITLNLTINQPTSVTLNQTACSSFTLNGSTYTSSGMYTQTLTNAAGCDSTITLNLTINQPTTSTTTVTQCGGSYTWTDGVTYTTSGTYTQLLMNAVGCDSTATLALTINSLPVATATDNGNATITASAGTSYQWINCTSGLAVAGATAQTFAPSANGSYAVVVSNASGCTDTSSCVTINNVGIKENTTSVSISVFPNPTHDQVTITMTSASAKVEVVDAQGKLLQTTEVISGEKVDLSAYETGVYFLRIQTENGSTLERIVKN